MCHMRVCVCLCVYLRMAMHVHDGCSSVCVFIHSVCVYAWGVFLLGGSQ